MQDAGAIPNPGSGSSHRLYIIFKSVSAISLGVTATPMPASLNAAILADAARGQLPDRFVGQGTAAGDDADVSFFVDVTGRDADAAAAVGILALAGRDEAGAIGADEAGFGVAGHRAFDADHVAHRN